MAHISPAEVAPKLGKGAQDTWWPSRPYGGRLDKTGVTPRRFRRRGWEQTGMAGAYTDQRLNLSTPWEGSQKICQGFKPDSGNLTVRDYRGASGNVSHGGNVNPACNRKSGNGNPPPTAWRARFLSQWAALFSFGHRPTAAIWQREEPVSDPQAGGLGSLQACEGQPGSGWSRRAVDCGLRG